MRRRIAAGLLALATLTSPLTAALSADASLSQGADRADRTSRAPTSVARAADTALARATSALSGTTSLHRDATTALATLRASYPDLSAAEKAQADRILARPAGLGSVTCGAHVCVHYTTSGPNRATAAWAQHTRSVLNAVWAFEVGALGYRAPATDATRGGNAKLDVYLQNLGSQFLYGYCAPEFQVPGQSHRASGYCALDNNYSEPVFSAHSPDANLRVTAAHEFFHAIQFNYDYTDDSWILEATSTWMEERYADDVNDNRQYLRGSQLSQPGKPLDTFENGGGAQYGNWIFFQKLAQRFGVGSVKSIWQRLDATKGRADNYSIQGVKTYLASKRTSLPRFYADFAAGNLFPARSYVEGSAYRSAPVAKSYSFGARSHSARSSVKMAHLTSKNYVFAPNSSLRGKWKLRLRVDGPPSAAGPAAFVQIVPRHGAVVRRQVRINASGNGSITVSFRRATVRRVTLTVANAGTRYRCSVGGPSSCDGTSLDNHKAYTFSATAVR